MTERKEGYYWVKAKARKDTTEQRQHLDTWFIGYYKPNIYVWTLSGFSQVFIEDDFIEINETRIPAPDEEAERKVMERINDPVHRIAHEKWKALQERTDLSDYDKKRLPWIFDTYMRIYHPDRSIGNSITKELHDEWVRYCTYCGY